MPDVNDRLNKNVMPSPMAGADSFNILAGILSEQVAVFFVCAGELTQNANLFGAVLTWFKNTA